MKKILVLTFVMIMILSLASCAKNEDVLSSNSVEQNISQQELKQSELEATDTTEPINRSYNCSINENGHGNFLFYYEAEELVKVEFIAFIKGTPDEIEAKEKISGYAGVTMIDKADYILFEIDIAQDGLQYLQDNFEMFKELSDVSWNSIEEIMSNNGYVCSERTQTETPTIEQSTTESDEIQTGSIKYGETILYDERKENMVCIEIQPSMIREKIGYYYIPEGEEQNTLIELVSEIDEKWEEHDKRWKGMKETGWTIWYNDIEYKVFEGGYLYRTYTDEEKGTVEYFEQKEELYHLVNPIMERIGYNSVDITQIKDIVSAKLELTGFRTDGKLKTQTITDKEMLSDFEKWFSEAEYILWGTDCGNQDSCLELTLADGRTIKLSMATDSCPNYSVNGVCYDYRPKEYRTSGGWYSDDLFKCFDEIYDAE